VLRDSFEEHLALVEAALPVVLPPLEAAVALSVDRLVGGSGILVFGNGGSAAQAQHFAAEITGRYLSDRRAWPAVALSADAVALTAVANDYGFERAFARQVEALARPGDVAVAISTSGTSPNVVRGAEAAAAAGCHVVALTGSGGGDLGPLAEVLVAVPSAVVPRVQEIHAICLHAWAAAIERSVVEPEPSGDA
jgi:D-sedoheptulose 7-phosphate isomerase